MRRTRMYRLGIAVWVCLWGWSGTSQALIRDHLKWVSIRAGQSYDSSSATTPGYFFVLRLRTDNTVSYAEFTTPAPASQTYTIPSATDTVAGDVHTTHKVWWGNGNHGWEYQAWFSDIAGLVDYPKGTYQIKLYYTAGGSETTNVAYVIPNTTTPIPQPTQKPNITAPAFGASVTPGVSFTWSACTDPNVNSTATSDGIAVEVYDSDDIDKLPKLYIKTATNTTADPCGIDDGLRSAQIMFQKRYTFNNADTVPCEVLKGSATVHEFEVTKAKVWRFSKVGSTTCHFWTAREDEKNNLVINWPGAWSLDAGYAFYACVGKHYPDLQEVYRFWNMVNDDHFYTTSEAERDYLIANWSSVLAYEGVQFYAYEAAARPPEAVPIYRLWQSAENMHYYTPSATERDTLVGQGWTSEGIGFYAYAP